jgi:hypothetical protein
MIKLGFVSAGPCRSGVCIDHLRQMIRAASGLEVVVVNTFIGRDWTKSVDDS